MLTTNAFYLSTKDKIVFGIVRGVNNVGIQYNANSKIETAGVETELRWQEDWGYLTLNHSYSQMLSNIKDYQPINQVTGQLVNSDLALAFPAHKFSLNAHYEITPSLSVNPSLILTTSRYGYDRYDAQGHLSLRKYSPEVLGNVYFRYQDALFKGLDLGIGVYNLFNANQNFLQPFNGSHAPLPGQSREVIFKLSYQL
jgi:outer membrane receptor protein involved in Fe transport